MTQPGDDAWWQNPELVRSRLRSHVEYIQSANSEVEADTGGSEDLADLDHLYRAGVILVRDADLPRVQAVVPGTIESSLINGVTVYRPTDLSTPDALVLIDARLGVGVATPDHVVHVTGAAGCCPATEPDVVAGRYVGPEPAVNPDPLSDGTGVLVSVVDTGFLPEVAKHHSWLHGVTGDEEHYDPAHIRPFAGHGTFVSGVVRAMAPNAEVRVEGFLTNGGAVFESEIVRQLDDALDRVPDIICLSAGTLTRRNLGLLGFEVFWESRLRHYKGTVLVAAAGNDSHRGPFWPAAFPWSISVGSLGIDGQRAPFTNFGSWVDVYAPGADIVNAFPNGRYVYQEEPRRGEQADFTNWLARWSGTSFSTPMVAGMIAARMSATGETARQAAAALLAIARQDARPRVGSVLTPDNLAAYTKGSATRV